MNNDPSQRDDLLPPGTRVIVKGELTKDGVEGDQPGTVVSDCDDVVYVAINGEELEIERDYIVDEAGNPV
jgi:hypothetical protein